MRLRALLLLLLLAMTAVASKQKTANSKSDKVDLELLRRLSQAPKPRKIARATALLVAGGSEDVDIYIDEHGRCYEEPWGGVSIGC